MYVHLCSVCVHICGVTVDVIVSLSLSCCVDIEHCFYFFYNNIYFSHRYNNIISEVLLR